MAMQMTSDSETYKKLVMSELENNGFIGKMRASIKSQVLKVLENQSKPVKQAVEFDYLTPFHKLAKSKEVILAVHLIRDFMKFYELEYTLPIFENETNIRENISKESLLKEIYIKDNNSTYDQPLLIQLLNNYNQLEKDKQTRGPAHGFQTANSDGYIGKK
jgi:FGFR1 oncogene partner